MLLQDIKHPQAALEASDCLRTRHARSSQPGRVGRGFTLWNISFRYVKYDTFFVALAGIFSRMAPQPDHQGERPMPPARSFRLATALFIGATALAGSSQAQEFPSGTIRIL